MSAIVLSQSMERVRALNDHLRSTFSGGFVNPSDRVKKLGPNTKRAVLSAVRDYDSFEADDDEHDYGAIEVLGEAYVWIITYFGPDWLHPSEDPSDTDQTRRVLTISLQKEWN